MQAMGQQSNRSCDLIATTRSDSRQVSKRHTWYSANGLWSCPPSMMSMPRTCGRTDREVSHCQHHDPRASRQSSNSLAAWKASATSESQHSEAHKMLASGCQHPEAKSEG